MKRSLWRGKRKDNGEWVYGIFHEDLCVIAEYGNHVYDEGTLTLLSAYRVVPETVGEFTGLMDRKKNHIFEGDIVRNVTSRHPELGVIRWCERDVRFEIIWGSNPGGIRLSACSSEVEYDVFGNVHDDPGLCEDVNNFLRRNSCWT